MTRNDFVKLINCWGYKRIAELGVAKGEFSAILATADIDSLVLVDKWNDHHTIAEKAIVDDTFRNNKAVTIHHMLFSEAATLYPDNYFDFVYVDGYAHTGQEEGATLEQWWPKIRPGAMFCGHDYHADWPKTIAVVTSFCQAHQLRYQLTDESAYPSWFTIKPSLPQGLALHVERARHATGMDSDRFNVRHRSGFGGVRPASGASRTLITW